MPQFRYRPPVLPRIITHKNIRPILDAVSSLACFQPGKHEQPRPDWIDKLVTLEFPAGEACEDGLKSMALIGRSTYTTAGLTGKEGFAAQGLEGKVVVRKQLFSALMNLRDLLPEHRGRILVY